MEEFKVGDTVECVFSDDTAGMLKEGNWYEVCTTAGRSGLIEIRVTPKEIAWFAANRFILAGTCPAEIISVY